MPQQYSEVDAILEAHGLSRAAILPILRDVQNHYRYLPQDVLLYIAKRLGVPGSKVFGVAAFDDSFSLEPKGKYFIKVCDGTACHMRKSPEILNTINRILGLNSEKHTTDDMLFTVETVSCMSHCGQSPVLTVNDTLYTLMTPEKVEELLKQLKEEAK